MARPRGRRANRRRHPRCPRAQSLPQVGACARLWEAGGAGPRRGLAGRVRGARGAVGASQSAWGSPGRPSRSPRFSRELSRCGLGEGGSLFPAHLLPPVAGGSRPAASSACCRPPVAGPQRHPGQLRVAHRPLLHAGPLSQAAASLPASAAASHAGLQGCSFPEPASCAPHPASAPPSLLLGVLKLHSTSKRKPATPSSSAWSP